MNAKEIFQSCIAFFENLDHLKEMIKRTGKDLVKEYIYEVDKDESRLIARHILATRIAIDPDFFYALTPELMEKLGYRVNPIHTPDAKERALMDTLGINQIISIYPKKNKFETTLIEKGFDHKITKVLKLEDFSIYYNVIFKGRAYNVPTLTEARQLVERLKKIMKGEKSITYNGMEKMGKELHKGAA